MMRRKRPMTAVLMSGGGAPTTFTIAALSAVGNVVTMRITASKAVADFEVGDITISAGGSLASFATTDNIVYTVSWTLAAGANTMDIAAGVASGNLAATQFALTYLIIQPDATAGKDTNIRANQADTNYGTDTKIAVGEENSSPANFRSLIQFDLSSISAGSSVLSAVLSLFATDDRSSTATTFRVFRLKRAWAEAQATWNSYTTGNLWATAGAFGAADCEQTDIGSRSMSDAETVNEFKDFTLTAIAVQAMIPSGAWTNNGFLIKSDTELNDAYYFAASDNATSSSRPKLSLVVSGSAPP